MALGVKTGGRQKGSLNKVSAELRQILALALGDEIARLPETLASLESADRLDAIVKLAKYILAPLESVSAKDSDKAMIAPESYRSDIESELGRDNLFRL